jgi:hypothetical protein
MTPKELSEFIGRLATEAAAKTGRRLTPGALRRISSVPPQYAAMKRIDVDRDRLQMQINLITEAAFIPGQEVMKVRDVATMLKKIECHYLWFC